MCSVENQILILQYLCLTKDSPDRMSSSWNLEKMGPKLHEGEVNVKMAGPIQSECYKTRWM